MISKATIINNARPKDSIPMRCMIYFLIYKKEIVYIGKTTRGNLRILSHISNKIKPFDSFFSFRCARKILEQTEMDYILKIKPKYNRIWINANQSLKKISREDK